MFDKSRTTAVVIAAVAAAGLGGTAIAGAAGNSSTSTAAKPQREALSANVAAKVKAAALDKVPGATVVRTEAGGPYNSAYHAHIKTSGGTPQVVLVNDQFQATAVQADNGRGGGGKGRGGHGNETALSGDTKSKVEAAVLAEYPGATILRSETNDAADAPYEAHIKTKDGTELEVTVSKDFKVVDANQRPAHP
jgi:hypothetical protein